MTALSDPSRLEALARTELVDSGAEEVFDRLTRLATRLLGTPVASMTVFDERFQHTKSAIGRERGGPIEASQTLCRHVVDDGTPFIVDDVRDDERIDEPTPFVAAECVAYCGVPLSDSAGHVLGSLCAIDPRPRAWSDDDVAVLRDLATSAMTEVELRVARHRLAEHARESDLLRQRESQLARVVETVGEAINLVDLDGRVAGWNPGCERLYGWTAEEVLGRRLTEIGFLVEDTDDQNGFSLDARALAGESVDVHRLRRRRKDGRIVHVDISLAPMRDGSGEITGVIAVARDVTERERLLTELAASEGRFRRTFDYAPSGIVIYSTDGRVLDANRPFCDLIGYGRDELVGRSFADFVSEAQAEDDRAAIQALLSGEMQIRSTEKRYRHKLGHDVLVRLTGSLVRDGDGRPLHFIAHMEDVTASRAAQVALQDARGLLDESQAVAHVGSWSYDLRDGVLSWSREQFRLHGFEPADAAPTLAAFRARLHETDRDPFQRVMDSLVDRPRDFTAEYRVRLPDGRVRTLASSAKALTESDGHHARVSGTTRDVTAERAAEAAQAEVEQRHRRLLQGLPDTMVVLYDTDQRIVSMQGGLLSVRGVDPDEFVGRTLAEVSSDPRNEELPGLLARALAGETLTIDHAGPDAHFQVEFAPFTDEGGTIIGAFTVWRDITARVAREDENRMLATMVAQSEDAIIAKDPDGRITEWRGGAERMYGYTREEAVGRLLRDLVIPPELQRDEIEGNAHVLAGGTYRTEARRIRKDGSTLHVSVSITPLRDAAGEVNGMSVIARDITAQVAVEAARREAEERLRVTIDHAPIGVALVELPSGRLLSANSAFGELLGQPDPVGSLGTLAAAVAVEHSDVLRADLALLATDDDARTENEFRCPRSDGSAIWLLLTGAPVPAREGAPRLAVVHALDIGERKRFEGQLQHLADHDPLTGLFNRRRFEIELERSVSLAERYGYESALMMIDLDGFKRVNDTLGHSHGDELISRVAAALRGCLRETDVIGRLGGDEFAVILASAPPAAALAAAEKVLAAIAENGVVRSGSREASVTASVGLVSCDGRGRTDVEALLVAADVAMYAAKDAGRNRVAMSHGDGREPTIVGERSWLHRLRTALDQDRFELFAQPIRPICADGVDGYELLLRLRDDDGTLIAPGAFLQSAERFDLVQEIDRWVFARALALLAARADDDVAVTVNMSGRTLSDPRLVDDLTRLVEACPVPPGRLVVEVTETAAIVNIERAREVARTLRRLGCRFALDDFGSGFASFYYLKHLEFDFVKIDGEFVRSLGDHPTDRLVVESVVSLARGLGAETIAEFVGDEPTVERLRELGVDYGQGFHLGRPGPVDEVLPAIRRTPAAPGA